MPADYRATHAAVVETPLGPMLVGASEFGVRWIEFGDDARRLEKTMRQRFPVAAFGAHAPLQKWIDALQRMIGKPDTALDFPLDLEGTPFQNQVWKALREIPAGRTESYSQLARRIGKPTATRAVASACAANSLAVAIPCHRVIRNDGKLGGYRWGLRRKQTLLEREESLA